MFDHPHSSRDDKLGSLYSLALAVLVVRRGYNISAAAQHLLANDTINETLQNDNMNMNKTMTKHFTQHCSR